MRPAPQPRSASDRQEIQHMSYRMTTRSTRTWILACSMATAALAAQSVHAQRAPIRINHENISVSSGTFDGDGQRDLIAFVHVFAQPRAPWMRLHVVDA